MHATHLFEYIGQENLFATADLAIEAAYARASAAGKEHASTLLKK